jgi:hypothetical protein
MITTFGSPPSPPTPPSDATIATAVALLAVAADPAGTERRMGELLDQIAAVRAAHAEADAAKKGAEDAQAELAHVQERERKLADEATRQVVASAAIAGREQELNQREQSLAQREAEVAKRASDLATRERMLVSQRESMRAALA